MLQHVDLQKLVALRIPKGPLIGRLKSGETVTLDDGRIIQPADIYTEMESDCAHQSTVLFANCPSRALFHCLKESPHLRRFEDKDSTPLDFIVHFTTDNVLNSDEYRQWMDDFGDVTKHLIVNGSSMCPIVPVLDGVYRTQSKLTGVVGNVMFPELYAAANMVTDDEEVNIQGSNNRIFAKPKQLYRLRMSKRCTQPDADLPVVDETNATIDDAGISVELNRLRDEYQKGICDFQTVDDFSADEQTNHKDVFPRLTTLGTSSSVPTKYRNQSGYLLELDASYALMLDCGDNTYGQMVMLYGSIRCAQMLMRLKLIALSHQHLDHIGGLVTIVKRRHEAFLAAGRRLIYKWYSNLVRTLLLYC
jgi:ribonuclease Z